MLSTVFKLATGALWGLTYVLIIWRGFADRTYGMPLVALCANLAWEFIFSFVYPQEPLLRTVNIVWLIFDLLILYAVLRFGPREFPGVPKPVFYAGFVLTLGTAFGTVLLVSRELDEQRGLYAAYGSNLLMSGLFIAMLMHRKSLAGQSLGIAVGKLAGTACASVAVYLSEPLYTNSRLLPFLYAVIFVFDLVYVFAVLLARRAGWARRPLESSGLARVRAEHAHPA